MTWILLPVYLASCVVLKKQAYSLKTTFYQVSMAKRTLGTFGVRTAWYDKPSYDCSLFTDKNPNRDIHRANHHNDDPISYLLNTQ
jgi:hypothetical protein